MQIDWWTLGLQAVNVLVLIWLLSRFFFRPIAEIIGRRHEETEKALAEAASARKAAAATRIEAESIRRGFAGEHDKIIADAVAVAEKERARLLDQAATDATAVKSAAEDMIAKERTEAARQTIEQASRLAVDIAEKLVGGLTSRAANDAFLDELCTKIGDLPADLKAGLVSTDGQGSTEVVTAEPLDRARADRCRERIVKVLGSDVSLHFRTDPHLLAGVELNGPHAVVRASWRDGLDRILEGLSRDADGR